MRFLFACFAIFTLTSFVPKEKSWTAIGDSITYLNDHTDETGNRLTKGYLALVTEKMPSLHVINQGHNGWTAGEIAERIDSLGLVRSDLYTIFLGTNDWSRGRILGSLSDYKNNTGNETIYGSFRIIIGKLRQLNKSADIVLMTPLQRTDFVYINDFHNRFQGSYKDHSGLWLQQIATAIDSIGMYEHIPVVDLYNHSGITVENAVRYKRLKDTTTGSYKNYPYPDYVAVPFNPDTDEYPYPPDAIGTTYDGLHPSDQGNRMIADMLVRVIKALK